MVRSSSVIPSFDVWVEEGRKLMGFLLVCGSLGTFDEDAKNNMNWGTLCLMLPCPVNLLFCWVSDCIDRLSSVFWGFQLPFPASCLFVGLTFVFQGSWLPSLPLHCLAGYGVRLLGFQ